VFASSFYPYGPLSVLKELLFTQSDSVPSTSLQRGQGSVSEPYKDLLLSSCS